MVFVQTFQRVSINLRDDLFLYSNQSIVDAYFIESLEEDLKVVQKDLLKSEAKFCIN